MWLMRYARGVAETQTDRQTDRQTHSKKLITILHTSPEEIINGQRLQFIQVSTNGDGSARRAASRPSRYTHIQTNDQCDQLTTVVGRTKLARMQRRRKIFLSPKDFFLQNFRLNL